MLGLTAHLARNVAKTEHRHYADEVREAGYVPYYMCIIFAYILLFITLVFLCA